MKNGKVDKYIFDGGYAQASAASTTSENNGKELDKMHGLNTYDYGARQYNPILAKWDRIDPLCEKYYSVSPYNYCGNNPIILVDPDGKQPTYEEALAMAQHVYGDVNDDVLIGGWQHSTFNIGLQLSNSENGLNSMIYERIVDGNVTEYAYVTAGTTDNQDKIQDMKHMKKTF